MYPRLNTDNHTKREMLKKKEKPVFDYSVRCFFINCNPGSTFTKDSEKCIAKCEKKKLNNSGKKRCKHTEVTTYICHKLRFHTCGCTNHLLLQEQFFLVV